ncbi:hypothetical protein ASG11_05405 [Sphingomonas sp. Leaf357]|nr:hypothetical protein ASG11_05405 [Sphingomonas sp. Leaf357]
MVGGRALAVPQGIYRTTIRRHLIVGIVPSIVDNVLRRQVIANTGHDQRSLDIDTGRTGNMNPP